MKDEKTIKTISVPADLWDRVQRVGKSMGETASGVVRMALRDALPKYEDGGKNPEQIKP